MARRATASRREASLTALSTVRSCGQDGPGGMSGSLPDVVDQHACGVVAAKTTRAVEHRIGAVVIVPDPHTRFDKVCTQRAGRYLQPVTVESHRVVVADLTLLLDAEDLVQIDAGDRHERRTFLLGRHRKAGVVRRKINLAQEPV